MKSRDLQPGLLYPAKLSFRIERQIKSFLDKKKQRSSSSPNQHYMKCKRVFFKKNEKIKNMNNKMAINTYLSTIETKKLNKQTSRTETES